MHTCFLDCELYGLHEWAKTWFPRLSYTHLSYIYTWKVPWVSCVSHKSTGSFTHTGMFARCDLSGIWNIYYFVAYLRMFSGGELWATVQMSKFVTCSTCDKLRHWERPESCIAFASTLIWLMPSAVNPTIDPLPDRAVHKFCDTSMSLARFLFLTISQFFMCLGDYSPCVRKLWNVGSLTRPACNDSGDALKRRLSGRI